MMKNISIVGTGLIGSSMALGLRGFTNGIVGFDSNPRSLDYAVKSGIIDFHVSLNSICYHSDIIIVSVPVDVAITIIPSILSKSKDDTIVIDVSSTKTQICDIVRNHPKRKNFIAAHPMAGSEMGGPQNADANLFNGRKVVICESELSSAVAIEHAIEIFKILGMSIEFMDAETHDSIVAMVSHLPQVVSFGLARTIGLANSNDLWSSVAASGFDSSTRLAKSSSDVWTPILIQNKEHISQYLTLFIQQIETIKGLIDSENIDAIDQFIQQSQGVREKFDNSLKNKINQKNGTKTISRLNPTEVVVARN